jgi:hypothetical protein
VGNHQFDLSGILLRPPAGNAKDSPPPQPGLIRIKPTSLGGAPVDLGFPISSRGSRARLAATRAPTRARISAWRSSGPLED